MKMHIVSTRRIRKLNVKIIFKVNLENILKCADYVFISSISLLFEILDKIRKKSVLISIIMQAFFV